MSLRDKFRDKGEPWRDGIFRWPRRKSCEEKLAAKEKELATALELYENIKADFERVRAELGGRAERAERNAEAALAEAASLRAELKEWQDKFQAAADIEQEPTGGSMGGVNE